MKKEIEGYINRRSFDSILHYMPAIGYELTDKQKPIDILRIRRIYNKPLKNYWFKARNKIIDWVKIRITIEII